MKFCITDIVSYNLLNSFRHSFVTQRDRKNVPTNIVSIHSNTSDEMIRKYYRSKSEYQMSLDHSKVFPESNDFIQKLEKIYYEEPKQEI